MRVACFMVVGVASACLATPPPPSFDEQAITAACAAEADAVCNLRASCSAIVNGSDYENAHVYGDDATCRARVALVCENQLNVTDTATTLRLLQACTLSYASDPCSDFYDSVPTASCLTPPGPGPDGSPCAQTVQCATKFCAVEGNHLCGTCAPQPTVGASCVDRDQCGYDLDCYIGSGATTGTCVPYVGPGMPCLPGTNACVSGYACVGDDPTTGTMGTCQQEGQALGAACNALNNGLPDCYVTEGWQCVAGACQQAHLVGAGEACGLINTGTTKYVAVCSAGGACVNKTCVAPAADGEPCGATLSNGPPCLAPAVCVVPNYPGTGCGSGSGSSSVNCIGTCQLSDPAQCF